MPSKTYADASVESAENRPGSRAASVGLIDFY